MATGDQDAVKQLAEFMCERALPLWADRGWDSSLGGFVERLNLDGTPDVEAPRRTRVQARQIYCFAKAAQFNWMPQARELALKGLDYLLDKGRSPDGQPGYVHCLNRDGTVMNSMRDTYDHAFILLALANVYQLNQDAQIRTEINAALRFIDQHLRSTHGGYIESLPPVLPRRQNPQMHLLEAMIALYDATGEAEFQNRAGEFFSLFLANLFDRKTETLSEYFEEDWSKILPVSIEAGHQAEWVWLLKGFERITGCPTGKYRAPLLSAALRYRDAATGCLVDEGDAEGRVVRSSRRCWPQTEIAKAWIAQAESGEAGAAEEARAALGRLQQHYLDQPIRGAWLDQFDESGQPLVDFVPASTFYHITSATSEAVQVLTQ